MSGMSGVPRAFEGLPTSPKFSPTWDELDEPTVARRNTEGRMPISPVWHDLIFLKSPQAIGFFRLITPGIITMTADSRPLTPKQKRFVFEYLYDLNSTAAAVRAGYSAKTAQVQGYQLLHKTSVCAAIETAMAERALRTEVNADRTLKELARIGFSDVRRLFTSDGRMKKVSELDSDTAAAVSSMKVVTRNLGDGEVEAVYSIKFWDKNSALQKIAAHLGMLESRLKSSNDSDNPLTALLMSVQGSYLPTVQNPPDDDDDEQ
ncbi:MAG: xtmA [Microvirga sp.]|jgi:phage terminase small subunit|nr:xtmA [Microvirga sp.]